MNKLMALVAVGMFGLGTSVVFAEEASATSDQPVKKEVKEKGKEQCGGTDRDINELFGLDNREPGRPGGDNQRGPGGKEMGRHGGDNQRSPGGKEMGRHGGDNQRMMTERQLQKYPKEMEEIKKLRETDPDVAMGKFQELLKKAKADRETLQAERDKFIELVKAYQKDKDPKQLEQIKAKVTELYAQRLEGMKEKIEIDENNLKERKAKYDESVTNKDLEITKKLERITNLPKMD